MHILLFDIDGTLLNTGGAGQSAMERTLSELFSKSHPVEGVSYAGRTDRAITEDLFRYYGIPYTEESWQAFQAAYTDNLREELHRKSGRVLPGITRLLEHLHADDSIQLGLLTGNLARGAEIKLRHYGLFDFFEFGGFGDHHVDRDEVARAALREIEQRHTEQRHTEQPHGEQIDRDRVWVIGDTPADVQCGRAIGARVVAVATGLFEMERLAEAQPDHLFEDFSDPDRMIQMLL